MQLARPRTSAEVIASLSRPEMRPLPAPKYLYQGSDSRVALAVESMRHHMTDEGWQIMQSLESAGYWLFGRDIPVIGALQRNSTSVPFILEESQPAVVVVQDKREWEGLTADRSQDPAMRFTNVEALKERSDIFKLTILKDAHQSPAYHRQSAEEMGCHAWIVYYNSDIVCHLAPFVRREHLVRTWHTLDRALVPEFNPARRKGCLLSGAISKAYPLRAMLLKKRGALPLTDILPHPGYHRNGCQTSRYLKILSDYRVAICTSSVYGYALRKIVEATACGCLVVTDLPSDEVLPEIDGNLVRVHPSIGEREMARLLISLYESWDADTQQGWAARAKEFYDYREMGRRLADNIEAMRRGYK